LHLQWSLNIQYLFLFYVCCYKFACCAVAAAVFAPELTLPAANKLASKFSTFQQDGLRMHGRAD
jgi:hypothetical protein